MKDPLEWLAANRWYLSGLAARSAISTPDWRSEARPALLMPSFGSRLRLPERITLGSSLRGHWVLTRMPTMGRSAKPHPTLVTAWAAP